ncbi:HAMP domain protein [Aeromicrobium marinum DSM 15272]|uniref:HAMP domain protein n=1 Tax=Aeromicrobium marinum DSM 15272 TaxID=585531 RepID=E2SE66_9ACTN|nr:adenylate/guanylate cyclase domain-containing protein [Aeromicrobium marinum]EFQ82793.1 HAMP domain protein [Aeromicrobium marinum DSM 15272]
MTSRSRRSRIQRYVRRMSIVWRMRVVMFFGLVMTSVLGAVIVYAVAAFVVPLPIPEDEELALENLVLTALVVPVLVVIGVLRGIRILGPAVRWVRDEREPTPAEQRTLLNVPRRMFFLHAALWIGAALFFSAFNALTSIQLGITVVQVVSLAGVTVSSIAYLVAERVLRPLARRALASGVPDGMRVRSVAGRTMFAWVLGTGVSVAGLTILGIVSLVRQENVTVTQLAVTMVVVGGIGFTVGGLTTLAAAKASSDPIRQMRKALARVEGGDLDVVVDIDDGTEIGMLQAGFNEMVTGLREREQIRDLFGRHVGDDVARAALGGGVELGGETRHVAVLFVDVIGSTTLATERPPDEVVSLLNQFFSVVIEVVHDHDGWINKFEGDAALAIWNAPVEVADLEAKVLRAARVLGERLAAEVTGLTAGIGVSAGTAVAGNVGAAERYEYTVIGDPVNEAARLMDHAKSTTRKVVARASLLDAAGDEAQHWEQLEPFVARGRSTPTPVATPRD